MIILKYVQRVLPYKGLLSKEKSFLDPYPTGGRGNNLTPYTPSCPVSPKGEKKAEKHS